MALQLKSIRLYLISPILQQTSILTRCKARVNRTLVLEEEIILEIVLETEDKITGRGTEGAAGSDEQGNSSTHGANTHYATHQKGKETDRRTAENRGDVDQDGMPANEASTTDANQCGHARAGEGFNVSRKHG